MAVDGLAVGLIGAGALIGFAGVKGVSIPSEIQKLIQGQNPSTATTANAITGSSSASSGGSGSDAPGAPANVSGNVALGKMLAQSYGWNTGAEWNALYALWEQESGWSNTADNKDSGAYGIPQALPATKMPLAAQPPSDGGTSDPATQIQWGLSYIQGRYGDPQGAWAHEQSNGWY